MAVSSGQNDGVSKTVALLRFVMVVDNGTAFTLLGLKFPPKCTFAGSPTWGWIAYSVGTLLGARTAAPERRHILFVSDRSFLVTAEPGRVG